MTHYFRPLVQTGPTRPDGARTIAGGWGWFARAEVLTRSGSRGVIEVGQMPADAVAAISAARAPLAGLTLSAPRLMGILNVTPDSFSDGGRFDTLDPAVAHARAMVAAGADILDVGGESTRPGAARVADDVEIQRTAPMIRALRDASCAPISIDTRKAAVARAALRAGAELVNDVSALGHDPELAALVADSGLPVCLMHAQGEPETMQDAPRYDNVLLDVYDFLAEKIAEAAAAGIPRDRIIVDPGIGFGKTQAHNLALLRGLSLFHGLGCAILLGASRKRFIGTIGGVNDPEQRAPGSIAVALGAVAQGVQILRVHDIAQTRQALNLTMAVTFDHDKE